MTKPFFAALLVAVSMLLYLPGSSLAGADTSDRLRCSQRLTELLMPRPPEPTGFAERQQAMLGEARALLDRRYAPCSKEGQPRWWQAGAGLIGLTLYQQGRPEIESQIAASAALFREYVLPRLNSAVLTSEFDEVPDAETVIESLVRLPEHEGLPGLMRLKAAGVFELTYGKTGKLASKALDDLAGKDVSQAVFDIIVAAAAPHHVRGPELLLTAIARKNQTALRRALAVSPLPLQDGYRVLQRAADNPEALAILLEAALRPEADGSPVQLPADEVGPLIHRLLTQGAPVDWALVDRLLRHGGDITNAFSVSYGSAGGLEKFIIERPQEFEAAVDRGLRLDVSYPESDLRLPPVFLMLRYGNLRYGDYGASRRAHEAIYFMLGRHNNVNQREQLGGASASMLEYLLEVGDLGIVRTLLEFGADPNQPDDAGYPVFGRAIVSGRVDALEALMAGKRKPNLRFIDAAGVSTTAWARCHGHEDVALWLEQRGIAEVGRDTCRAQLEELAAVAAQNKAEAARRNGRARTR